MAPPAGADLVPFLSKALRTTPIMLRVHDPEHVLADATARQLIDSLGRLGFVMLLPHREGAIGATGLGHSAA